MGSRAIMRLSLPSYSKLPLCYGRLHRKRRLSFAPGSAACSFQTAREREDPEPKEGERANKVLYVDEDYVGTRVDRWLRSIFPGASQAVLEKNLRQKRITRAVAVQGDGGIEGGKTKPRKLKASDRLEEGERLVIQSAVLRELLGNSRSRSLPSPTKHLQDEERRERLMEEVDLPVIYEDDQLLVINKAPGLAMHAGSKTSLSLLDYLESMSGTGGYSKLRIVHRLDKDTSGALVLAKSRTAAEALAQAFRVQRIRKTYIACVRWPHYRDALSSEGTIVLKVPSETGGGARTRNQDNVKTWNGREREQKREESTGDQVARTDYEVIYEDHMREELWLKLSPLHGKKRQLRYHCAEGLGAPILGDKKFGGRGASPFGKLYLHARTIEIPLETLWGSDSRGNWRPGRRNVEAEERGIGQGSSVEVKDGRLRVIAPFPPHFLQRWVTSGRDLDLLEGLTL